MNAIEDLRKLGYHIEAAQQADNDEMPTVYYVEGPEVTLYIAEDDAEAWAALLDSHDARASDEPVEPPPVATEP